MENKTIFLKARPLFVSLIILLIALIVFVTFQLQGLRKPQKVSPPSEVVKEEVLPVAETKIESEGKPILSTEKKFTPLEIQYPKTNLRSPKGDLSLTGFTIQVASFQDKARAEIVANGLKQKGYQPVISSKALPSKVLGRPIPLDKELPEKGTWYRVFVGDFESEEKARELLKTLKEDYKDSFIKLR